MVAVAIFLAGVWLAASPGGAADKAGEWKTFLDEETSLALIKRSVEAIQDEVKKPKKDAKAIRRSNKRIQVHAVLIAAYAQTAKPSSGLVAAYHKAALDLVKAVRGKNPAQIKKVAGELEKVKPSEGDKFAATSLNLYLEERGDVMEPFRLKLKGGDGIPRELQTNQKLKGAGGNGIEEKIRALAGRRKLTVAQMKKEAAELALLGNKTAVIAQLAHEWAPTKEGKKDPKDWRELSVEMRDAAVELSKAAKEGSADKVFESAKKLNSTCTRCHKIFKQE
jgi:hypothetical protein